MYCNSSLPGPVCAQRNAARGGRLFWHAMSTEKKTERVTVWMGESLAVDLMRLAARDDRKLSEYIVHVLTSHAYGHSRTRASDEQVAMRGETARGEQ